MTPDAERSTTANVFDDCVTPLFVRDAQRHYVLINAAAAALLGRPDLAGLSDESFLSAEAARQDRAEDDEVIRTGTPCSVEREVSLGGRQRTFLLHKSRTWDGEGRPLVVCAATDITALKDAQAARADTSSILRSVLDSSGDGIFSFDRDYRYTSFNPTHAQTMRMIYGVDIVLGGRMPDYQSAADWALAKRNLDRTLAGESFVEEAFSGDEARTRRFFEITHHPVRDVQGAIIGAAIFGRDITERRRAADALRESEERLRQAQKMDAIGRLAGGIAHDFNNLLTVILSSVSFLEHEGPGEGLLRDEVAEIGRVASRARGLTSQLLAFSRRQVLDPVVFDLNARIKDLGRLLHRIIGEDVQLLLELDPSAAQVAADPNLLDQALMNLIVNARDAMPSGGTVVVKTGGAMLREGKFVAAGATGRTHVAVSVADSGHGMSAEVKAHLFEPFFTTKECGKGTGLGLAIVYGAVQQAAGSLEVESEPGRGTTFSFYLPMAPAVVAGTDDVFEVFDDSGLRARPGESVLVVEDDPSVRRATARSLEHLGYLVFVASNLGEATERLTFAPSPLSLVVTDVVMPGGDGLEVYRAMERLAPGVPVVFMSGFPDDVVVRHGISSRTLQKPFTPEALGRKVRGALDASRSVEPAH
ncbi:MAG: PAS domain-containing protein [Archangium sp.]|nr:PAS domain-containing protein [Archangium sp.]